MSVQTYHAVYGDVHMVSIAGGRIVLGCGSVEFTDCMRKLASQENKQVVIDFTGTSYLDSTCIGEFGEATKKIVDAGGIVKLSGLEPRMKRVLQITKLDIFEVYEMAEEAVKTFV